LLREVHDTLDVTIAVLSLQLEQEMPGTRQAPSSYTMEYGSVSLGRISASSQKGDPGCRIKLEETPATRTFSLLF
jgi:hypothetical protein